MRFLINFLGATAIVLLSGLFFLILTAYMARADSPFEMQKVSIEYRHVNEGSRYHLITENNLLPNRKVDKEIVLNLNVDIYRYLYWNNKVISFTDLGPSGGGQFRTIAWQYILGFRLFSWLNLELKHRSEHTLDTQHQNAYPVLDSVGVEIFLLGRERGWGFF